MESELQHIPSILLPSYSWKNITRPANMLPCHHSLHTLLLPPPHPHPCPPLVGDALHCRYPWSLSLCPLSARYSVLCTLRCALLIEQRSVLSFLAICSLTLIIYISYPMHALSHALFLPTTIDVAGPCALPLTLLPDPIFGCPCGGEWGAHISINFVRVASLISFVIPPRAFSHCIRFWS
jgi:hypothetical protein